MSDKKKLLTESEIRRFQALANIPAIGNGVVKETLADPRRPMHGVKAESGYGDKLPLSKHEAHNKHGGYGMEEAEKEEEVMPDEMSGEPEAETGGDVEEHINTIIDALMKIAPGVLEKEKSGGESDALSGVEADDSEEEKDEEGEEDDEESEEESELEERYGHEEEEEEEEEEEQEELEEAKHEEEEEEEEEEEQEELQESKIVNAVLARVTARLVSEAKKAKGEKDKMAKLRAMKKGAAKKEAKDPEKDKKHAAKHGKAAKKKHLEEANAPAPKSTMSNASKAGVAKGHGPGKGAFGVTSKVTDKEWGTKGKGDEELETLSASAEHTVTHGKKNLATLGGNKK